MRNGDRGSRPRLRPWCCLGSVGCELQREVPDSCKSLFLEGGLVAIVWHDDRERHRFRRVAELNDDVDERLGTPSLWLQPSRSRTGWRFRMRQRKRELDNLAPIMPRHLFAKLSHGRHRPRSAPGARQAHAVAALGQRRLAPPRSAPGVGPRRSAQAGRRLGEFYSQNAK
jgi:hypothetical protein